MHKILVKAVIPLLSLDCILIPSLISKYNYRLSASDASYTASEYLKKAAFHFPVEEYSGKIVIKSETILSVHERQI